MNLTRNPFRVVLVSVILGSFSSDSREQRINWATPDVFGSGLKEKEDCSFHSTVRSLKSEVKDEGECETGTGKRFEYKRNSLFISTLERTAREATD